MRKRLLSLGLIIILAFSLTGCKSTDYKKAVDLQENGDYSGALEIYKVLFSTLNDASFFTLNDANAA